MNREHASLQHRPFLTPIWLSAIGALVALCVVAFALWIWGTANATTVIVIRHAEKESGSVVDPPLSTEGEARAARLAEMLGVAQGPGRLDAIYVSPTVRSQSTAAPLASRLRIVPVVAPADDAQGLAKRALREHSGGRVLIIGHANTVSKIVAALSGRKDIPDIGERDFGVMYVVTVPRIGRANVLRLSY
ncbi:MAG TPA: phosphoglycerate mutase family protein [Steroidobacteraceae bacterium]|jgi:broad specificity phosphatase PhoE